MNFENWFKTKFGRLPSDSEFDKLLKQCFEAGVKSEINYGGKYNYETRETIK